jgi:heme/copper-type cytochrome/quinol oxidase subunit 2
LVARRIDVKRIALCILIATATTVLCGSRVSPQQTPHHEFVVHARRYAFEPARLEVHQGDLVRITLRTEDIPHSLVVDALRIAKKATPDRSVTFELLADRAGVYPYYCNLTLEGGCRNMTGQLVVLPETDGSR